MMGNKKYYATVEATTVFRRHDTSPVALRNSVEIKYFFGRLLHFRIHLPEPASRR